MQPDTKVFLHGQEVTEDSLLVYGRDTVGRRNSRIVRAGDIDPKDKPLCSHREYIRNMPSTIAYRWPDLREVMQYHAQRADQNKP